MNLNTALALLVSLLTEANRLGEAIRNARAQGRDSLSDEEVGEFAGLDDDARRRLQEKIDALS